MAGIALPEFMDTNPKSRAPEFITVKTFVAGEPTRRANACPPLKKNTLIGTPAGMFPSEKANGVWPGREAVSVWASTAFVEAFNTLMMVPDTVPVIVTVPVEAVGGGAPSPESLLGQAERPRPMRPSRPQIAVLQTHSDSRFALIRSVNEVKKSNRARYSPGQGP